MKRKEVCFATENNGIGISFDVSTGEILTRHKLSKNDPHSCVIVKKSSPKYRVYLPIHGKKSIQIFQEGKFEAKYFCSVQEPIICLELTKSEHFLFGGTASGLVYCWEVNTGKLLKSFKCHFKKINCLKMSTDDLYLITASDDTTSKVFRLVDVVNISSSSSSILKPIRTISSHSLPVTSIYCLLKGKFLTCSRDRTIHLHDFSHPTPLISIIFPSPINCLMMDCTEHHLFCGCENGRIYEVNLYPNHQLQFDQMSRLTPSALVSQLSSEKERSILSIEHFTENKLNDYLEGMKKGFFSHVYYGHQDGVVALSDSKLSNYSFISSSRDGSILIWDKMSKQKIRTIKAHSSNNNNHNQSSLGITNLETWIQMEKGTTTTTTTTQEEKEEEERVIVPLKKFVETRILHEKKSCDIQSRKEEEGIRWENHFDPPKELKNNKELLSLLSMDLKL